MRQCAGCDVPLNNDNTYKNINKWCRACWASKVRTRRRTNPAVQTYDRCRAKTPERKKHSREITKKWREKNPTAYKAQTAVGNAIRNGKLRKEPCLFCESIENLHAHHKDYSKPLDIVWVCAKCHHRLHAMELAV